MVSNNYLSDIYRRMAGELNPTEEYFTSDSRFMVLDEIFSALPPGNFCDFGCGRGAILQRLSNRHKVYGTEYDAGLVAQANALGFSVVQVDLNEAEALPFGNVSFDSVLISEVCEHLLNPRNALRLARRALRPGGVLVVTVPNAVPLLARLPSILGRTVPWLHYPSGATEVTGHLRFFTTESMSRLLAEEKFEILKTTGVSFRFNGTFWQRFCYWVARVKWGHDPCGPTRIDRWLGRVFPGLSPGLLFVARR
jgi:2-polyprenyl-3-methyl-5-hydroxy-6-metoxy-1,4-benzoquinol methylase